MSRLHGKVSEHSHYMHGSQDVTHKHETPASFTHEDLGRFLHGSEDVAHNRRWSKMLEALDQEEAFRQSDAKQQTAEQKEKKADERQEQEQERWTSYW